MKKTISILAVLIMFASCQKAQLQQHPVNSFTGSFTAVVSDSTIRYEVTVWNDFHVGVRVKDIIPQRTGKQTFTFIFSVPSIPNCSDTVMWQRPMFGSVKEVMKRNFEHDYWDWVTITQRYGQ